MALWSGAVHAVVAGAAFRDQAPFPASPHQSGHEVLPHPAFRDPSPRRYRRCLMPRDGPSQLIHPSFWKNPNPNFSQRIQDRPAFLLNVGDLLPRYDMYYPPDSWVGKTAFLQPGARGWIVAARSGQQWMEARVQAGEPLLVAFHTVFFPGWAAYVDGRQVPIEPTPWQVDEDSRGFDLGICQVPVPAGNHVVRIQFENTPLRFWSSLVSLLSVLIAGVLLFLGIKRRSRLKAASIVAAGVLPAVLLGLLLPLQSRAAWAENPTILDFIEENNQHGVLIAAPAGDKAEDHVNTQNFVINGESRKVLFMHPPASASKRLWVPSGARLELGLGINPAVWDKTGDGVEFRVEAVKDGRTTTLLSRYIDPKANAADRKWFDYSLDLQQFAGEEVELRLQTLPGASADFDWAGWSDPRVVLP